MLIWQAKKLLAHCVQKFNKNDKGQHKNVLDIFVQT